MTDTAVSANPEAANPQAANSGSAKSGSAAPARPAGRVTADNRVIGLWLLATAAMVAVMVVIGGITRLTESGLSMVEWRPLIGALPPLDAAEWQRVFDLYRQTSEYRLQNAGMSLAEFRTIFWWEYIHRVWGRLIGLVFGVPLLWLLLRGRVRRGVLPHLLLLLLLGGFQGWLGWWMVQSGFVDRTDVSQYRLVGHLGLALVILGYLTILGLRLCRPVPAIAAPAGYRLAAWAVLGLVFVAALSGGVVAGLDGGLIYNSFPTMNGAWVPEDYWGTGPGWLNPFDNPSAAQFHHRMIAVATVVLVSLAAWRFAAAGDRLPRPVRDGLAVAAGLAVVQAGLGVTTLLLQVPLPLAAAHQAGAVLLLLAMLYAVAHVRGRRSGRDHRHC